MTKRVAIIGAAYRFPGTTPETFWHDLKKEKDFVTQVASDRWSQEVFQHPDRRHPGTSVTFAAGSLGDISGFDAEFFGISPREAAHMDPQQRILLELAWESLEDAGMVPAKLRGTQCGVYLGIASQDYSYRFADDMSAIDSSSATGNTASVAANRLSYLFDLHGPSLSLDTACSSSLVAFHQACQAIRSGDISMAITGGISLHLHPYGFLIFSKAGMLSSSGRCRVFDADGDGYVRSEGGGLFILKEYEQALADNDRILAVVAGSAMNTDGRKAGLTVPDPAAQATLMRDTYRQAGIAPEAIDYLEAHGTGTAVGDPVETRAIGEALGQQRKTPLPIGSVKSNAGHLETASGVIGLAKALHSLHHREVPATIGIRQVNPAIKTDEWNLDIVTRARPLAATGELVIGVNSFGFGGANAHVILSSAPPRTAAPVADAPTDTAKAPAQSLPIRITARSADALTDNARALATQLRHREAALYDTAHTLFYHRTHLDHGALCFADTAEQAAAALERFADGAADDTPGSMIRSERLAAAQGPVFVYSGNGCQWAQMGRDLLQTDAGFGDSIDRVDAIFQRYADFSLRAELDGSRHVEQTTAERLERTEIAQPTLFALQVALTQWLRARGVEPAAVLGHSVGEVAAAWAAGALSLEDAVKVIYCRSDYQGRTRGLGAMSAVALSADDIAVWLEQPEFGTVCLAGINSPNGITLAGPDEPLAALEKRLHQQGIIAKRLPLDYAFHSAAMDATRDGLIDALGDIAPRAATVPFISTVTGNVSDGTDLDADYWWRNIRQPVLFHPATAALVAQGHNVFVEVGAHPVLRRYLTETLREQSLVGQVIGTLKRHQDGVHALCDTLGKLLLSGLPLDSRVFFPVPGERVNLPRYAWQRTRYWVPYTVDGQGLLSRYYQHPLLGYPLAQQANTWESQLDVQRLPWLAGHVVGDGAVFPGAGFVELALAAAHQQRDPAIIDIEALEIHAPLLLDGDNGRSVRVHLDPTNGSLHIDSREPVTGSEWQRHASARCMQESRGFMLRRRAPAIPKRAPDYTQAQHQALAERIGLHYHGAFQAVRHGWIEGDSVIGDIALDADTTSQLADLHLHPGLLDSAFQLFIPLLAAQSPTADPLAFVPVRVGRVQMNPNAGTPVLAHAVMQNRAPHSFTADFALYDAAGNAVAVLGETRFKAVRLTRSHRQALDYLDVTLVPGPLAAAPLAFGEKALEHMAMLGQTYAEHTGQRYAQEVAPLLDSLSEAFIQGGLPLDDGAQPLAPQRIWQLLVQDYPDYFAPIHLVGRLGIHREALASGRLSVETLGINQQQLSALNAALPGTRGWQALAATTAELIEDALHHLPDGQRLTLLEAGPCAPALGQRLLERFARTHGDHAYRYRLVTTHDTARHQALQLQERFPLIDVYTLDEAGTPPATADQAQLALISIDITQPAATRQLIEQLPAQLAPGAQLLVIGTHPSLWLDTVLATSGIEQTAVEAATVSQWLTQIGLTTSPPVALEDGDAGTYLLHAQAPDKTAANAAQEHVLIAADEPGSALATRLADAVNAHGASAQVVTGSDSPDVLLKRALDEVPATGAPLHVVDIAGHGQPDGGTVAQTRRCTRAQQWSLALETLPQADDATPPTLWITTRGVAALWQPASLDPVETPDDAALWGFGRSLANEATSQRVVLLDLPGAVTDEVLTAWAASLVHRDSENELAISTRGQRFATRLRSLPSPRAAISEAGPQPRQAMSLGVAIPGQLRHLEWQPRTLPEPRPDEVEVRVKATGLNFRDVMYTLGLLSDEAIENGFAGATLGLEFSGEVVSVGDNVTDLAPGQGVVGFGPASFSDTLIAQRSSVAPLPENTGYAAAATIPTTFFTVYYALKHLARLEPGEKVLIHGAAGGVGIAALQIARWLGAEIYATVGSEEKRDFLRLMEVDRLYDSRSLTFAEEILEDTQGDGVDVVLNSLAGEAIHQNLRVLRPFGRFLELGKRDFYANTPIGLRPFRNNLSYFGIDSDQLMKVQPELTQRLFNEMMALFNDGTLHPLPFTLFQHGQIVDAFRYMQQARQIGKVVVTYEQPITPPAPPTPETEKLALAPHATYLVTGGLSGFGLKTAQWLVEKGARNLVLLSRRGAQSEEAKTALVDFAAQGINVMAEACDVTQRDALDSVIDRAEAELGPLAGVVHAATVIDDGLIRHLDEARIQAVLAPKIDGARHLDELTRRCALDFFIVYSSATTLFGNPGQASYVAANHWLEGLAAARRQQGLPATCVRWGAIEDVGFLARNTRTREALQERLGGSALQSDDALQVLEQMLIADTPAIGVLELDWNALARFLPTAQAARFDELARTGDDGATHDDDGDLGAKLLTLAPEEQLAAITSVLRAELAGILLMEEDNIDADRSIYDMGFDSLMGVELMTALESRLGIQVPVMALSEASTVTRLAQVIRQKVQHKNGETSGTTDESSNNMPEHALKSLAHRHGAEPFDDAT
ncbi:type I polyketide synthase [Vreelandella subglaciescola]|uniref:Acyl transferase domain-containing protein n=1 Tax=Vreelandella subglaciescola TaxID=29571 RepID=A0A1M7FID0_9GAMM|nr:type I polyketide synthase [Halomonas subglaciescola]SHM03538.1 Acyl transferase domain-containing protein [Halomonas subglaciescola]